MSSLLLDQYRRLLDSLPAEDPWPTLEASGFLDVLVPEDRGGAGLSLDELFDIALETGRRSGAPRIVETMAARLVAGDALRIDNAEPFVGRPLAAAVAAAQMAGAMAELQAMTVEYATVRKQFGREIGRFQAVQHQIASLTEEAMAARMAARAALVGMPRDISDRRAAVAKYRCSRAALVVSAVAHAVHGAIGVSEEHPLHLHTRNLRAWRLAHGAESWWADRLGAWVLADSRDVSELARGV